MSQRAIRRDRAFRRGPALFLLERTFEDVLERIALVNRRFRSALLIGCPDQNWPRTLAAFVDHVAVAEPGPLFAASVAGAKVTEDQDRLGVLAYDLCVAIGTLDTVNDLPLTLANIRASLRADSLLIGAMSGGETVPILRAAMRAADAARGAAAPHVHPRIDGPSLCGLLSGVGFVNPVVDIDRVPVRYSSLRSEVADLRAMAATNILTERSRIPITRAALAAAESEFTRLGTAGKVLEIFEILHFAAWSPAE